ncbi:hypothetical protein [Streptomyces sp. NPDC090994]|uniref:hypothetical protein n=1 Tax=Streptomyces sp. NPDC090994 TaxID=3365969 RepID=UPI0037F181D3
MRRVLTTLALIAATALASTAGLITAAPAAHAAIQDCINAAQHFGTPLGTAVSACQDGRLGDFRACQQALNPYMGEQFASEACRLAARPY